MPKKSKKPDEKFNFIPASEVSAKWFKNPKFVEEYEALEGKFAKIGRQMDAKQARRERRKAMLAWVRAVGAKLRGFWAYLTTGLSRRVL